MLKLLTVPSQHLYGDDLLYIFHTGGLEPFRHMGIFYKNNCMVNIEQ